MDPSARPPATLRRTGGSTVVQDRGVTGRGGDRRRCRLDSGHASPCGAAWSAAAPSVARAGWV